MCTTSDEAVKGTAFLRLARAPWYPVEKQVYPQVGKGGEGGPLCFYTSCMLQLWLDMSKLKYTTFWLSAHALLYII